MREREREQAKVTCFAIIFEKKEVRFDKRKNRINKERERERERESEVGNI